ncbi:MAG: phosphoribosylpyrophosphate synthetase [Zetaproteobacteria bacterium CG12_big_fil_rev_8_21_14_0_65_55_1124]|nr:MAG: phosphoribosylpyrophosphate synthetase [Zetaproteobacteria bacterium CG1_02_55_237]PIS18590.1 MAG: phosphoribosylpyrophosphate synthetase [Zetaproteobacteria bacterium CG08_land_8_20_14_0_20_55_17]PIW42066.1 MAG: phosphoribosylpyrophosphate synthetase [Zetaproteobacteria bacterium CG12_big_fil_rev_8_21_14_0_65_55_1124]PIY53971.1 MAG: phosphoribosylpyrophosphate synthetase [Zetaproteobacteria bacterium CG_4_10_14_0_8_um_filter_55_43]PIZ39417.1 MAG: phosphoribosylpyrophosphate synthetase 
MLVLGFEDYCEAGRRLAEELGVTYAGVEVHRFPDGEHRITLPASLPEQVVVCRSLFEPNEKLIDLLLLAGTARELGARQLILVAPYLCYMRQDKSFHPGEAVSQRIIGKLLAEHFDVLITVDPHMHRTPNLAAAVPVQHALNLSAAVPIAGYLQGLPTKPLLVGPDEESQQWVQAIAGLTGLHYIIAEKLRSGDRNIEIVLPEADVTGQDIVLIDDIISTGCTLARAAEHLLGLGASSVRCIATHMLPNGGAASELAKAGVSELLSTDSIQHPSNRIFLAKLLAEAIRGHIVSSL